MSFLCVRCKSILPFFNDVVTLLFFAHQIQVFAGENKIVVSCFNLVIDKLVSKPFSFARTMPKGNGVSLIPSKEGHYLGY